MSTSRAGSLIVVDSTRVQGEIKLSESERGVVSEKRKLKIYNEDNSVKRVIVELNTKVIHNVERLPRGAVTYEVNKKKKK